MKKKLIIISLAILILLSVILIFVNKNRTFTVFNKEIKSLSEIDKEELHEYIKIPLVLYGGQSINKFYDTEIAVITAYKMLCNFEIKTEKEVSDFIYEYFGIKNYKLKEGEYSFRNGTNETIRIEKKEKKFYSSALGFGLSGPYNSFREIKVKGNKLEVHYDYKTMDLNTGKDLKIYGKTIVYLEYSKEMLHLKKIKYIENK